MHPDRVATPAYGPGAAALAPEPDAAGPDALDHTAPETAAWRLLAGALAHSLWVGPVLAVLSFAWLALLPDGAQPFLGALATGSVLLAPVVVLAALGASLAAGLARLARPRGNLLPALAAAGAALVAVQLAALLLTGPDAGVVRIVLVVLGLPTAFIGGLTGLVTVRLAAPRAYGRPGWADGHAVALGVVAAAALLAAALLVQVGAFGGLLGRTCPGGAVATAQRTWPWQQWCTLPDGDVITLVADAVASAQTALLTLAPAALVLGVVWRAARGRRPTVVAVALGAAAAAAWAWSAALAAPPAAVEFTALPGDVEPWTPPPVDPPTAPEPSLPSPPPGPADAAVVRTRLDALAALATQAAGPAVLWPQPLAVGDEPCTTTDGRPGTLATLTGRFTTRDLATATDNVDFLLITQDNEEAAERIVQAWEADGGLGTPEPMKGEWYQGDLGEVVDVAHVGFVEGVGDIRVTTFCGATA